MEMLFMMAILLLSSAESLVVDMRIGGSRVGGGRFSTPTQKNVALAKTVLSAQPVSSARWIKVRQLDATCLAISMPAVNPSSVLQSLAGLVTLLGAVYALYIWVFWGLTEWWIAAAEGSLLATFAGSTGFQSFIATIQDLRSAPYLTVDIRVDTRRNRFTVEEYGPLSPRSVVAQGPADSLLRIDPGGFDDGTCGLIAKPLSLETYKLHVDLPIQDRLWLAGLVNTWLQSSSSSSSSDTVPRLPNFRAAWLALWEDTDSS